MLRVSVIRYSSLGFLLAAGVAASLFASIGDLAAAASRNKAQTASLGGEAHIQLAPFMAPIRSDGRRRPFLEPVTLVLKVSTEAKPTVCRLTPRIFDAVLRELHRKPIPADRKKNLRVEGAEGRLATPVSKALGGTAIQRVYILPGAHPKNVAEEAARRLPMAEIVDCGPVDAT